MGDAAQGWWRRLAVDTTPLRTSRDFRRLFSAGVIAYLGGMIGYVAIPYQLYAMTGSNLLVGLVGLVELVPLVVFGLWGGALADHADRRTLVVVTGALQAALTAVLVVNAFLATPQVWLVFVVAAALSAAQAVQRPAREALVPRTVAHDELTAAVALGSLSMQTGLLVGPTIGGLVIAHAGVGWCLAIDALGLLGSTLVFTRLRPYPSQEDSEPPSLRGIGAGLAYAVRRRDLLGTYVIDIAAMLFALPTVLYPALAATVLREPSSLGLIYSAETVGGLAASLTAGWATRVHHHGRAIVVAAAAWGACIGLAGVMPTLPLILLCLAASGACDQLSGIFRGTVWHQTIPDAMRGRLAGIEMLSYSVGPLGGQVRAGAVADRFGVRQSIASGGVLCVLAVTATTLWLRGFWSYDRRTDPHAVAERDRRARADSHEATDS